MQQIKTSLNRIYTVNNAVTSMKNGENLGNLCKQDF